MEFKRSSGILLHLSSLPGNYGTGDLGQCAYDFVDWLAKAKQKHWQVLPLNPTNPAFTNSVYDALSSWAGNTLYISFDKLVAAKDLLPQEVAPYKRDGTKMLYHHVIKAHEKLMPIAAARFFKRNKKSEMKNFNDFCKKESAWLHDWALFLVIKNTHKGLPWWEMPAPVANRDKKTLQVLASTYADDINTIKYAQFRFFEQWFELHSYAKNKGVDFIVDIPVYCAKDSCDVWCSPKLFKLNKDNSPAFVGGVPPDLFSATGQNWQLPVYNWKEHKKDNFKWWIARLSGALRFADILRLDHFRGFEAYWEIPAKDKTAVKGKWVLGPGDDFFKAVDNAIGIDKIMVEDLGIITGKVNDLRLRWNLPGIRVVQFAFSGKPTSAHLPYNHEKNSVVYTGTHDNDTALGWYRKTNKLQKSVFKSYTNSNGSKPNIDMIKFAFSSVANLAILQVQDILGLGSSARMNIPGTSKGNWVWKLSKGQLKDSYAKQLAEITTLYGRAK